MQNIQIEAVAAVATSVIVERASLVAALTLLAGSGGVIERRNTIPILSNVMIAPESGGVRLTGTDLDIEAAIDVPAAWEAPAAFTLEGFALLSMAKAMDGETVTMTLDDGYVTLTDGGMAQRLSVLPCDDFPTIASKGDPVTFTLDAATLAADLDRVRIAVSTEETRYYLNGIYAHLTPGADDDSFQLNLAATDGHRLVRIRRAAPPMEGEAFPTAGAIIPRKMIAIIVKAMGKKPAGDIAFELTSDKVRVRIGRWSILSKLIDGSFPDYQRVIPSHNDKVATFAAADLASALGKLAKAKSERTGAVKLALSSDGCAMTCNAASIGVAAAWDGGTDGEPLMIGCNVAYLATMAGIVATGDMELHLADASAPILILAPAAPELTAVLMPMRVDGTTSAPKVEHTPFQPVEAPFQVFEREYRAAFIAIDNDALRAAVATYRASDHFGDATNACATDRAHNQIAIIAARVRRDAQAERDGKACQARQDKAAAQGRRASNRDRTFYYSPRGSFAALGARERAAAELAATLAGIDGYSADDDRRILPVILTDGARRFIVADELRLGCYRIGTTKADGTFPRGRIKNIYRTDIARILPVKADKPVPVDAAPAADVAALVDSVAQLVDRIATLESTVAAQAAELATVQAAPIAAPASADGGRDAYIATLIAERDAALDRATQAERLVDRAVERETVAAGVAETLRLSRDATAGRILAYRARAAAQRADTATIDSLTSELTVARAELARLAPLAAAITALMPAAASNVVPIGIAA